jgi:predicted dehydrogenase
LHARQAMAALERGVAVFCQKPLGRDEAEVQAVVAAAEQADRLLAVDLSYRHTAAVQTIAEPIRSGELGRSRPT